MPDTDNLPEVEVEADLMQRLRDAQQAYDEVKEYLDDLKDELKARYHDVGPVRAVCGGEPVFTYTTYETTRIDSRRLKRDWPDIWHSYAKTLTHERLAITRPKAES